MMFNFFKKKSKKLSTPDTQDFELELTASVLAYEIARIDGEISKSELNVLMEEIINISKKVNKDEEKILSIIETYSKNSVSFFEFVEEINQNYSKNQKLSRLEFRWKIAYADGILEVNEERLIRRLADMINVKDIDVLKLKNNSKL